MKKEKIKPKYPLLKNLVYYIRNAFNWDKSLVLLNILRIPAMVLLPFCGIFMPKLVISCIERHAAPEYLLLSVTGLTGIIVLLNIADKYTEGVISSKALYIRLRFVSLCNNKIMDTDYANIENPAGQMKIQKAMSHINNDDSCTQTFLTVFVQIIVNIFGFALYGGVIAIMSPIIPVFLLLITGVNYFVLQYARKYEHRNKDNWTPIDKKIEYIITKSGDFTYGKDIRLYGMAEWLLDLYNRFIRERLAWTKRVTLRWYFTNIIDALLIVLRDGIAYGYLIYMVLYKGLPVSDFVLYFAAIAGFSNWVSGIIAKANEINRVNLDLCDIRECLDMPDNTNRGKGLKLPDINDSIRIEFADVSFTYPGNKESTIKNMSFIIEEGEKIALVGLNGAGKTTIVKLICGFYPPTNGSILLNGTDIRKFNRDEYFSLITAVFQDIRLFPLPISKNIALCGDNELDLKHVCQSIELAGLSNKISSLKRGIDTPLVKSVVDDGVELSGGEAQRLALARALYKDAPLIILDEPTASLDPIAENELYLKYNELTAGKTSIFISHRLSSTRFCDRILFIDKGELAEQGSHYELMEAGGKYAGLFEIQSHYYKESIAGGVEVENTRS